MLDVCLIAVGLVMLYFGANWLVSGASGLALALGVPEVTVGLTIVAYGTSAPEVVVSLQAAVAGYDDVVVGNVVGSNCVRLGLILGLSVLIVPASVDRCLSRRSMPMLLLTAFLLPLVLGDGHLAPWEGFLLLGALVVYTARLVTWAKGDMATEASAAAMTTEATASAVSGLLLFRLVLVSVVGLAILSLGGHALLTGAVSLAWAIGMSERVVGLTIVAIGTSLPEMATSVVAAVKGHSDIAVGNLVGSNIVNVLGCLGVTALVGGLTVSLSSMRVDVLVMILITSVTCVAMRTARCMTRWEGALLLLLYLAYLGWLLGAGQASAA